MFKAFWFDICYQHCQSCCLPSISSSVLSFLAVSRAFGLRWVLTFWSNLTIFLVGDTPLFLAVCCFWEIQNYSNPLAPVGHFIFLPGGPENFSESLKLHRFTILELSYGMKFWCIQNSESFFVSSKFSWIMDYAFILSPSWETPITWDFLDPSFIEIVILLVFLFFFYAFYHICILLSCLLAICNLVLISVTIFSSLFSV